MLRTPSGWKAIEEFQPDDLIVSRPEHRPEAANTVRKVVHLMTRSRKLLELRVDARKIDTTPEHPFWVIGKGWVPAAMLQAGMEFLASDNRPVKLDRIADLNRTATVYNLEIEADHTYFVGGEAWGFDVWSHNHEQGAPGAAPKPQTKGHSADWELRSSDGTIATRGTIQSGSPIKPGRRLSWPEQLATHTETKLLTALKTEVKFGDIITIRGKKPPCNPGGRCCQSALNAFAKENGITIYYTDTITGTVWKFPQ